MSVPSQVQYHADFEKNKAKFTQVADDPETQRLKKNTKIISNVAYHGELERKAEMERKRSEPGEEDEGASLPGLSRRPCDMLRFRPNDEVCHVVSVSRNVNMSLGLTASDP
ncbi:hypothetical protein C7M84_022523 [Penaeus vannamei]|uniref:Uncharacterized protein n=1 Tax=Penaeus vannamei TaxID=6689 RepID=A0A3R7QMZ3_PENVA|nr:hypothetical protein C7M84_022523 [Penaeus vannamei]